MVNTVEKGWQECKLAAVAKRQGGAAAAAHEWGSRELPKPAAVWFRVGIGNADGFAAEWRPWLAALGLTAAGALTVLGDGAKWLWARWEECFPGCKGVLDFYHLSEHLAGAARGAYGERPAAVAAWLASVLLLLLAKGWDGLCEWVARLRAEEPKAEAPTEGQLAYAAGHLTHLDYAGQLAAGRPIGSGPIEGGCKNVVGRRLKQTGARWLTGNVKKMATLAGAHWADDWRRYWSAQLAI